MDDLQRIRDIPKESPPIEAKPFSVGDMVQSVKDFWEDTKYEFNEIMDNCHKAVKELSDENPAEYHLRESIKSAEKVFTTEVITAWGKMSVEERNGCIQEYAHGVADALGINFKGIIFENLIETDECYGRNNGDGAIHLDTGFLYNPAMLMNLIDTIAHEEFHQFQMEACKNPEKFNIDEATIKEWRTGLMNYTDNDPTAYDPWGYFYNPLETGARHYGESVVRELTKDLVNKA